MYAVPCYEVAPESECMDPEAISEIVGAIFLDVSTFS